MIQKQISKIELLEGMPHYINNNNKIVIPIKYIEAIEWAIGLNWINFDLKDWNEITNYRTNIILDGVKEEDYFHIIYKEWLNLENK